MATIAADMFGQANAKTISYNLTGTDYYQYAVHVTKGASRTADGGACLAHVNQASGFRPGGSSSTALVLGAVIAFAIAGVVAL